MGNPQNFGPFKDVHPTQTGRRPLGSLRGTDLAPEDMIGGNKHNESRWIRCWQCGFPVDTERDLTGAQQDGVAIVSKTQSATGQDDETVSDPEVRHGCPFCGADESSIPPRGINR